jgi:hypothetical protein
MRLRVGLKTGHRRVAVEINQRMPFVTFVVYVSVSIATVERHGPQRPIMPTSAVPAGHAKMFSKCANLPNFLNP